MADFLITVRGRTYRIAAGDDLNVDEYLKWLVIDRGKLVSVELPETQGPVAALSRQQVAARLGKAIPTGFPEPDVIVGEASAAVRGWLESTVAQWELLYPLVDDAAEQEVAAELPPAVDMVQSAPGGAAGSGNWALGEHRWSGVPPRADRWVNILTSRGVVAPSGKVLTRGPLPSAAALAEFVWHSWPVKASPGKGLPVIPQIWITGPALRAAGMAPPAGPVSSSVDLSDSVSRLFGCKVTSAKAGWFTAMFPPPGGGDGESRRVQLVLLPFLWLDASAQRPNDEGLAGTRGTGTELPDDEVDEDAAVAVLAERIGWLSGMADIAKAHASRPPLLPAARPATVAAALMDEIRARGRTAYPLEPCPLPDTVYAEIRKSLDPTLEWKNMPHTAKGDSVDVEVDQRAAYLASAGQVELGYGGTPVELSRFNAEVFADKPPFGLWRVTTPAAYTLDGLDKRLPLPHGDMSWDDEATFWATTRGVQQLITPVTEGGAGLTVSELVLSGAWIWPNHRRMMRGWADVLRDRLAEAIAADRQDQIEVIKNIYKAFIGRMGGSAHPPRQRCYQQPAWVAAIRAETRARATRYAATIAADHGLYPIAAHDIDAFTYRLPAGMDPAVLEEASTANGKYRVKAIRSGES